MKLHAIRENHLYQKAYRGGARATSRSVTVHVLRDKQAARLKKANPLKEKFNRVGITASKKIGGAVERNRAKRVIREAYRLLEKEPGVKKGFLVVIVAHESATVLKMQDVHRDMQKCFLRLEMLLPAGEEEAAKEKSSPAEGRGESAT